MSVTNN